MPAKEPPSPKYPQAAEFVAALMGQLGVANPTELAARLGPPWTGRSELRKLYKWNKGDARPDFESTMALMRAAGWLRVRAARPKTAAAAPPEDEIRQRAVDVLEELVRGQQRIANFLGVRDDPEAEQSGGPTRLSGRHGK